ncbi:hypothetical protein [Halobacteriovorax sp. JY17]|uniref:hypothetical protein n=1 Tax=Halobacteriovorax sp. JY17 TaxID=2014617 RepID=UPI000C5DE428|nr:hypothetical protein [Halobacteriovorax sp. JY17]PIK14445.1 MAG: hypothetical protein CES88_08870 [Halobacteriovorax sp. JY17]
MEELSLYRYEVKVSKTEHKVPVVNDVHLHSIYNPIKEAAGLMVKNTSLLKVKNELLILGLGFGYHIAEAILLLEKEWGQEYRIVVIEPNEKVYSDYKKYSFIDNPNIQIYSAEEISELYKKKEFVNYLLNKPGIISHPASFNLYENYFKNLLSYKAPRTVGSFSDYLSTEDVKESIKNLNPNLDLMSAIDESLYPKEAPVNNNDHFLMAFKEMVKGSLELEGRE